MELRTGRGMLVCLSIMFCILSLPGPTLVSANPIPIDLVYEGRGGGSPVPYNASEGVYFSEERILADIGKTSANVRAEYTFKNTGAEDVTITISLPFLNPPQSEIDVESDGQHIDHSWEKIGYHCQDPWDFQDIYHFDERIGIVELDCIDFEVQIPSSGSTTVDVVYSTEVPVYDSDLNTYEVRWFSYLVGSAITWNRTIDHAYFEFSMKRGMYDGFLNDHNPGWDVDKDWNKVTFTQEHYNWTPEDDFIELSWKTDRPSPTLYMMTIALILQNRFCCSVIVISSVLLIGLVVGAIRFLRKRKERKKNINGRTS